MLNIIAALNKKLSKAQLKNDLKGIDSSLYVKVIAKLATSFSKKQLKRDLKELNDLYVKIGADLKIDKNVKSKLQKRINELQNSISEIELKTKLSKSKINAEVVSARKAVQARANRTPISFDLEIKKSKAIADIEYVAKKYSKLFSNASASKKYNSLLSSAYSISDESQLRSVRTQLAAFTSELKANNLASQSLSDKWRKLVDRSRELFSAATIVTTIFSQIRQSVSTFLKLDTAMTNLYKVQNDITSRDQFSGLLTKWNKLAQNLSVTTESLINSAAEWSKIGFDLDMSEQLAQITAIFEKTAEISNAKANSTLISVAQAFPEIDDLGEDDYVKRVETIGNKVNKVGNEFAISSEGVSDALQNSAAALHMANNDLNESIAIVTTANKIFQNPDEVGNMAKILSARLRGQKGELEALGEDTEGMIESVSKIQTQILNLTHNRVNIFKDDNETLKSTYQIVLEIGKVYDSLSDKNQASLLEIIGGKQRMSAVASLLLNYKELEKVKEASMNADNSMQDEYNKYLESAEAHITTFKEKTIEAYSTFMSGDLIKYTADIGSGLLDLVNKTDLLKHSLIAITTLKIGQGISAVGGVIASTAKQMNILSNAIQQVKNLPIDDALRESALNDIGEATKNLTEKNLKLLLSQKQLEDSDKITILNKHNLTEQEAAEKLTKMSLTTATNASTAANTANAGSVTTLKGTFKGLTASIKATWAAMSTLQKASIIFAAISTAWSIFSAVLSKHNEALEETREANTEASKTASDNAKSLLDLKNKLEDGTTSTEDLTTAFREQLRTMGYTETQINSLISKYGNLAGAMDEVTRKALEDARTAAYTDIASASKLLENASHGGFTTDILIRGAKTGIDELDNQISEILSKVATETAQQGRVWIPKDDSAEDLYEYYKALQEVSSLIQQTANDTNNKNLLDLGNFFNETTYGEVTEALDKLSESAEMYGDAIDRLHNADAQLELSDYLKTNDINSKEAFDEFVDGIKNSTQYSESYKEVLLRVANDAFPQFSSAVEKAKDSAVGLSEEMASISDIFSLKDAENNATTLSNLSDQLSSVESAYNTCLAAKEEYDEQGYLSVDTLQKVLALGDEYLQYLFDEEGNVRLDTDAFQQLVQARINDMEAQALSNLAENIKQITDEATATEYLTQKQNELASSYADVAANALLALRTVDGFADSKALQGAYNSFKTQYEQIKSLFANTRKGLSSTYTGKSASKSSAAKAVEDATKKTKDYIEAYMKFQKQSLESGRIDYNTYCNSVSNMLKSMYKDGKISAQDYHDYVGQMLETQLDVYKKALSAIQRRYDKEISSINDVIDAIEKQNDSLEKQKDEYDSILSVVDSVYEKQIKALENEKDLLQDKIDAINDANDALDLQFRKEQALYELKRAQEQRTKKLYVGDKGYIYDTDKQLISEAKKNLQDIKTEELIHNLEKEQEAIDTEIEVLQKYRDLWAEITDVYGKNINEQLAISLWGKNYEKIILSNRLTDIKSFKNKYISIQKQIASNELEIESFEQKKRIYSELKEQWSAISDVYENSMEDQYAAMLLGQQWESDILSGRIDTLNSFKNNYISILQAIDEAAWNSANEQIKAAKEAQKAANGTTGNANAVTGSDNNVTTLPVGIAGGAVTASSNSLQSKLKSEYQQKIKDTESKLLQARNDLRNAPDNTSRANKQKLVNYYEDLLKEYKLQYDKYAGGTTNAKKGPHLVSEREYGDEIIIKNDDSAVVAHGEQLYPFEGGETVIKASETEKILSNTGNFIPLEGITFGKGDKAVHFTPEELMQRWQNVMPNYASMVQTPNTQMPKCDFVVNRNETTPVVQNINLTLPNVTNESGYERIQKELRQTQLDAIQIAHRR